MNHKLIVLLIGLSVLACTKNTETKKEKIAQSESIKLSKEQISNLNLKTDTLLKKEIPVTINAMGYIDVPPNDMVEISLPITARVKSMAELLPGKILKKGEVFAEFESYEFLDLQEKYLSVKAELEANLKEFNRQKELLNDKISSQKDFDKIQYQVKSNQSLLESIKLKLQALQVNFSDLNKGLISETIKIKSPFNGGVKKVEIVIGKTYNPSTPLLSIIRLEHLHAELKIYEENISSIKKGNLVNIYQQDNTKYPANIFLIGNTVDQSERTISVHSHFENDKDQSRFIVGQQVRAEILTNSKLQKVIPIEGIIQNGNNGIIYSLAGETIYQNPVKILGQFNEWVAIEPEGEIKGMVIMNQASGIANIFSKE